MGTFFTADTHFGHANIIRYSNRPFRSAKEMDDVLIANINRVVHPEDTLYHLGDFAFGSGHYYRDALNCKNIHLILGNHDKEVRRHSSLRLKFRSISEFLEIRIGEQDITLCHYSMRTWNRSHHSAWQLYGHSHGSLPDDPNALSFDVGVDCWDYAPIPLSVVSAKMAHKTFKPIDHHGQRQFETNKPQVSRY